MTLSTYRIEVQESGDCRISLAEEVMNWKMKPRIPEPSGWTFSQSWHMCKAASRYRSPKKDTHSRCRNCSKTMVEKPFRYSAEDWPYYSAISWAWTPTPTNRAWGVVRVWANPKLQASNMTYCVCRIIIRQKSIVSPANPWNIWFNNVPWIQRPMDMLRSACQWLLKSRWTYPCSSFKARSPRTDIPVYSAS